ncbi:MAG TPA: cytochrome c3 family protein [Acidobacteriaceae bacterium]|nr:cytochrome c3 family protein [Acidobacteriaceae bacterium]
MWKRAVRIVLWAAVACTAVALLVIWRGFRAVEPPSAPEAAMSRGIRDLAIPWRERRTQNPLSGDAEALQQGHIIFLSECAGCHGTDGRGGTRIGTHLYPRVPDLRSASTQSLSDGQLHYIIANGVRFTGMPALETVHHTSGDDAWKLVLFVRSLRPLAKQESAEEAHVLGSAHYVGSAACAKCHASIYRLWRKTPMANVVRDPRADPHAVIPDLATNTVAPFRLEQVAFVYGSVWKQRYFVRAGDSYAPLPVQWDISERKWLPYHVPTKGGDWWAPLYPDDNMQRPTGPTCDGCHSVGYDIQTHQPAEWNVGCERCHGPGSAHVGHPVRGNIVNPAHMDAVAENDVCVQCHSQGRPLQGAIAGQYYDWPVGYQVGLRLQDYWKLEDCRLGTTDFYYFPDCTAHKNRMQGNDFAQSVMYRHQITCSSCHDVHGTENYAQLIRPVNEICLSCHGPMSPNGPHAATLEAHTHHRSGSAGSQCVACHMPAIEGEGVPGAFVHAHTFRFIWPEATEKYGIPNPCTTCHRDKNNGWAEEAMARWSGERPWRPQ